jgi:hypothetical protein
MQLVACQLELWTSHKEKGDSEMLNTPTILKGAVHGKTISKSQDRENAAGRPRLWFALTPPLDWDLGVKLADGFEDLFADAVFQGGTNERAPPLSISCQKASGATSAVSDLGNNAPRIDPLSAVDPSGATRIR